MASVSGLAGGIAQLTPGKMLRTRLAARLAPAGGATLDAAVLECACAATELLHTASLCHDDVIDNAFLRRRQPALWRRTSASGAVLIGDLLFCAAMRVLLEADERHLVALFVERVREVCAAEAEQELSLRGRALGLDTCLRIARGKTGPLFAFPARCCGGDDPELSIALEEAGYRIGTAYQLADDLLDVVGDEALAGKTLGSDRRRRKVTIAVAADGSPAVARTHVSEECAGALECLESWPAARAALERFLAEDLAPVLERQVGPLDLRARRGA